MGEAPLIAALVAEPRLDVAERVPLATGASRVSITRPRGLGEVSPVGVGVFGGPSTSLVLAGRSLSDLLGALLQHWGPSTSLVGAGCI